MKIYKALIITVMSLLLTGCYTQLQLSQKSKSNTDEKTVEKSSHTGNGTAYGIYNPYGPSFGYSSAWRSYYYGNFSLNPFSPHNYFYGSYFSRWYSYYGFGNRDNYLQFNGSLVYGVTDDEGNEERYGPRSIGTNRVSVDDKGDSRDVGNRDSGILTEQTTVRTRPSVSRVRGQDSTDKSRIGSAARSRDSQDHTAKSTRNRGQSLDYIQLSNTLDNRTSQRLEGVPRVVSSSEGLDRFLGERISRDLKSVSPTLYNRMKKYHNNSNTAINHGSRNIIQTRSRSSNVSSVSQRQNSSSSVERNHSSNNTRSRGSDSSSRSRSDNDNDNSSGSDRSRGNK